MLEQVLGYDGNFFHPREVGCSWGKPSLQQYSAHMSKATVKWLDDQLQWPDTNFRLELAGAFPAVFHGSNRVGDVEEFEIQHPVDQVKDQISWSEKNKTNINKMLSVMDCTDTIFFQGFTFKKVLGSIIY